MRMTANTAGERLYLANLIVLIAHQIDAAYWQEWDMFHLPGGIQLFVLANVLILFVILTGYRAVLLGLDTRVNYFLLLAGCGIFAVVFHGIYFAVGDERFKTAVSLVLLLATAIISVVQLCLGIRWKRMGSVPA